MKKIQSTLSRTKELFTLLGSLNRIIWKSNVRWLCIAVCVAGALYSLITLGVTLTVQNIIDELMLAVKTPDLPKVLWVLLGIYVVLITLDAIVGKLENVLSTNANVKLSDYLVCMRVQKMSELDLGACDTPQFHDAYDRAERGMYQIQTAFNRQANIIQSLVLLGGTSAILAFIKPIYIVFLLVSIIPSIYVSFKSNSENRALDDSLDGQRRKVRTVENQFEPSRISELVIHRSIAYFFGFFKSNLGQISKKEIQHNNRVFRMELGAQLVSTVCTAYIIVDIVRMAFYATDANVSAGTIFIVFGSIMSFRSALMSLNFQISALTDNLARYADFRALLETKPLLQHVHPSSRITLNKEPCSIEFQDVWFKYPNQPEDRWILKGLNLKIEANEKIALVGENGAGKSTLLKLLARMYDPVKGCILINGVDLKKINLESYYDLLSYAGQHYTIYPGFSIEDNIYFGDVQKNLIHDEIVHASQHAEADGFIQNLEHGYQQTLGNMYEHGTNLSGGEQQKLTIARALYRKPTLFVLDEPTANIDASSEVSILNHIMSLEESSVILVAHRITTITFSQRIVVLKDGVIAQDGNHRDLLFQEGPYKKLYAEHCKNLQ